MTLRDFDARRGRAVVAVACWVGCLEKDSQESIPVFGVITPAAGYRTRESF